MFALRFLEPKEEKYNAKQQCKVDFISVDHQ